VSTQVVRRLFDASRDARRHVILHEPGTGKLFEVVGVRGLPGGDRLPEPRAALALIDAGHDLPDNPFEELAVAPWVDLARVSQMVVIEGRVD
jgi:hypothetical protein